MDYVLMIKLQYKEKDWEKLVHNVD